MASASEKSLDTADVEGFSSEAMRRVLLALFFILAFSPEGQRAVIWVLLLQSPHGRLNPYFFVWQLLAICLALEQLAHKPNFAHCFLLPLGEVKTLQEVIKFFHWHNLHVGFVEDKLEATDLSFLGEEMLGFFGSFRSSRSSGRSVKELFFVEEERAEFLYNPAAANLILFF